MVEFKRDIYNELMATASSYPVVTLIGPRQSGKTTLVKAAFPGKAYVSLEDPDIRAFAQADPRQFLAQYSSGAILDEVQRVPHLLSYLQGIVDADQTPGQFVLTGSHQLALQQEISQSLAGRTGVLHLMPLSLQELKQAGLQRSVDEVMFNGFYPRIYKYQINPVRFYRDYVQTYIERDVKLLINIKDLDQFQRFLTLCASRIGQLIDYSTMANDLGISRHTIKEWLSILKASFILSSLSPYFENLGKRTIKSSKLYFSDVGLACYLLGIREASQLSVHPLRGSLFENLVVNELSKLHLNKGEETQFFFYRDSNKLEVDLLFRQASVLVAIEIKSSATFHQEFLKGLIKFQSLAKQYQVKGYVVYSGEAQQQVQGFQVLNYNNMADFLS